MRSFFFPYFCQFCRTYYEAPVFLCDACTESIVPVVSSTRSLGADDTYTLFAVGLYTDPLRYLLHQRKSDLLVTGLCRLMMPLIPPTTQVFLPASSDGKNRGFAADLADILRTISGVKNDVSVTEKEVVIIADLLFHGEQASLCALKIAKSSPKSISIVTVCIKGYE